MTAQLTKINPTEAWDLANTYDWEEDGRFQDLWYMICNPDAQPFEAVVEELQDVLKKHFQVEFDPFQDYDEFKYVDIPDELDDLQRAWGRYEDDE